MERLIAVATGGRYNPGLVDAPYGISRSDAASFIAQGVVATVTGAARGGVGQCGTGPGRKGRAGHPLPAPPLQRAGGAPGSWLL